MHSKLTTTCYRRKITRIIHPSVSSLLIMCQSERGRSCVISGPRVYLKVFPLFASHDPDSAIATVIHEVGRAIGNGIPAAQFLLHFREGLPNYSCRLGTESTATGLFGKPLHIGIAYFMGISQP